MFKNLNSMLNTQKHKKLENSFSTNNKSKKKKNIIVGLSGGVDSSLNFYPFVSLTWKFKFLNSTSIASYVL